MILFQEALEMKKRIEKDRLAEMKGPADKYQGVQIQQSLLNFQIGKEKTIEKIPWKVGKSNA